MAWTQAQLDAVEKAIASGATQVKHGDFQVNYRSQDEMIALRDRMKWSLGLKKRTVATYASFSRDER